MLVKLNNIIAFALIAFFLSWILYPLYIRILKKLKAGKTIREVSVTWEKSEIFSELHKHKSWTPTMWWWLLLLVMIIMIAGSYLLQRYGMIKNTLLNQRETYIILFWFFSMWLIGFIDDLLNIKWHGKIKWLSAKAKLIGMFVFSAFIARWFYRKLGVDYINLWPLGGKVSLWLCMPLIYFIITISIVNAINITDGLDWLAWWLMTMVLFVLAVITFFNQTYIATTVVAIVIAMLISFMFYNINPAKIFMGDSWAFALGWFVSTLLFLLNMRIGIFLPFIVLFLLFIIDVASSSLQIFRKKTFKKKLFPVAPLHHLFEKNGHLETTIVMKAWLLQWILAAITVIVLFYEINAVFIQG